MPEQSISEIIRKTSTLKTKKEKVNFLKQNNSLPLKNIMVLTYDPDKRFLVPQSEPPYTPSQAHDNHGMLFREVRKLKYIVEGFSDPKMKQSARESVFINMLETVHRNDAGVLLQMIKKEPFKGITKDIVNEAFGLSIK